MKLPAWVGKRKLNNIDAGRVCQQRAVWWRGRQWYVLRRWRPSSTWSVHAEWSREWGFALMCKAARWYVELGFTGPLVLDLRGNVAHSVLGVARP